MTTDRSKLEKYDGIKRVLAVSTAICAMALLQSCGKASAAGQQGPPPTEVSVITIKPEETALSAELPGRVAPFLIAEVRPQIGGIIEKRLFEEGADVKAGDVLYQIDPALYKASYDKAFSELAKAKAQIISIRKKFERYEKLIKSNAISQQEYDNAEADLKTAEANILSCKAAAETARINLDYTKITAPISGRIGKSNITVGALVTANHLLPLAVIQQLDPIYVDVTQSSTSFLRFKRGIANGQIKSEDGKHGDARVVLEDGCFYPLTGVQQFRDVTVDKTTGSFILRMVFPNPDKVLLPGMFVRAVVGMGVNKQAILVPQQAVSRDLKGRPSALIVGKDNKVEQRTIVIEQAVGNKWLVTSGLLPGDRVIVEGMIKVKPGSEVKAVPFDEEKTSADSPCAALASI